MIRAFAHPSPDAARRGDASGSSRQPTPRHPEVHLLASAATATVPLGGGTCFPYGDQASLWRYATYSQIMRFTAPDPYGGSMSPAAVWRNSR